MASSTRVADSPLVRPDHDVVIVGGGPAGLSTALFLLHENPRLAGRLLLIEKEHYPREKYCAGGLGARAEQALARIGVHVDVPSVPMAGISAKMPRTDLMAREGYIGRVVRRIEFDAELAQIARRRGVHIAEGVQLQGMELGPWGVKLQTNKGELHTRVVIGADGVGSGVRKALGLGAGMWRAQVLEVDTELTEHDGPRDVLHFDVSDSAFDGYAWDFPTLVDGKPMVCTGVYRLIVPGQKATSEDLNARLSERLARRGLDLSHCKKKRYAERGFAPHEPCAQPRVLLVGEAAGVDPITGEGIAQALLYGEAVAPYLARKLESNELIFSDWADTLARTKLGFDMRLRHFICKRFFGAARSFYETGFEATPEVLQVGIQYFGGLRLDRKLSATVGRKVVAHSWKHRAMEPFTTTIADP